MSIQPRAVRDTLGIKSLADLTRFDHDGFWSKWDREYELDLELLGRTHLNAMQGSRRRRPRLYETRRGFVYHMDRRYGGFIWQACSYHPCRTKPLQSLSTFVANYGRGPFLTRKTS